MRAAFATRDYPLLILRSCFSYTVEVHAPMGDWSGTACLLPPPRYAQLSSPLTACLAVKRRFNDFITLNKDIALRYPRAPLPSLPGRRWFGSLSPETVRLLVQSRRMRTSLLTRIRR
jgi:hypothetical protein